MLNVFRVIARRWYVVLLGLLLTAGLAFGAMLTTPSEFKSRALILLLPSDEAVGEGGNPFLVLADSSSPPASSPPTSRAPALRRRWRHGPRLPAISSPSMPRCAAR